MRSLRHFLGYAFLFVAVVCTAYAVPALAQTVAAPAPTPTAVVVPVGDWLTATLEFVGALAAPAAVIVIGWLSRLLPAAVSSYLATLRVDQLLSRAIGWGISAVKGATAGKTLTVDVGNKVIAEAVQYAVDHAPSVVEWAGGADALREKIIARLDVEENAKVVNTPIGAVLEK